MKARWMILTVLAAALIALGVWRANAMPGGVPVAAASTLAGSGTIEADSVRITAQTAGRLLTLSVDEGDEVKNGQVVAELDPALPRSEMAKARAALAVAQAQLAQVKAGPRAVDMRRAEAALALAGTVRDGARVTLSDAQAAQDNPQDLSLRVLAAETQAAVAEQKQAQAEASVAAAQAENDFWSHLANLVSKTHTVCVPTPAGEKCQDFNAGSDVINSTFFQWNLTSQKLAGAYDALGIARAAAQAARTSRDVLQAQLANPLAARMQVDAAQSQLLSAEAAVQEADATLALARAGATPEQLRIAELNVQQAQAAVETIQVQLDQLTVRAPLNGLVTSRTAQQGEMALPGVPLLTVANLDEVRLTMYIPETQIALVKPGQKVTVRVDSLPGRAFAGAVTYIATQAEFTPRNAQTAEERAKLVFAIRVTIANADHALKPGMPADAELEVQ